MSQDSIPLKRCSRCKNEYPATTEHFMLHKGKLYCQCHACRKQSKISSHQRNRENDLARSRRWAENNHERVLQLNREYVAAHKDQKRAYDKVYNQVNSERNVARVKAWVEAKPDHAKRNRKVVKARRRARIAAAEGSHTQADIALQLRSQTRDGVLYCWWCNKPIEGSYHVDHIIPLARGGTNYPNNLCIACPDCNLSKSDKLPHEWTGKLF